MFPTVRWQDWVTCVLGGWLVFSPWILGFGDERAAMLATVVAGFGIVFLSLFELSLEAVAEEWVNVAIGLGLAISPVAFGFGGVHAATVNAFVVGGLVMWFSLWALGTGDTALGRWWRDHVTGH